MAHVDRTALAATTLNRKWYLDVNTNTYASPTWVGVFGVMEFKGGKETVLQDDSDFENSGWKSQTATALSWVAELKLKRAPTVASATAYDTGQEALRVYSDLEGIANKADVRFYEVTTSGPTAEAYRGYCTVTWNPDGGPMDALDTVSVTLTGIGARTAITHPDGAPSAIPTVTALDAAAGGAAGGTLVMISGTGFTGVTGADHVLFGTTNATSYKVINDNVIFAVAPAHLAGAVAVSVENATGVSTVTSNFTYS